MDLPRRTQSSIRRRRLNYSTCFSCFIWLFIIIYMIYHYSYHYRAQSSDLPRHEQLLLYSPSNQALVSFHPIQLHLFVSFLWCICYIVVHRADEYLTQLLVQCARLLIKSFPPTSGLRSSCMHVCQALEPAVLVCQALPMHLHHAVELISLQVAIYNFSRQARLDSSSRTRSRISRGECTWN